MTELDLKTDAGGVTLRLFVKPRASQSRVLGVRGGALEVAVAAAPVDGEANRELVETLAKYFRVPRRDVRVVGGATGRNKRVSITGVSEPEVRRKALG